MVDWQTMFNAAAGVVAVVFGWLARTLWDAVGKLTADVSLLREEIARDLVRKDDFRDELREVKQMLERIFDKLDGKADK